MKNIFKALVAVCAISLASGAGAGVIVGDKEWRQVTETVNFSWNDFNSVCDATTGACSSGTLSNSTVGTVSFDGWTWASLGDVAELFQGLNGWDGPTAPNTIFAHVATFTTWAPDFFFNLGFLATSTTGNDALITFGLVRDTTTSGPTYDGDCTSTCGRTTVNTLEFFTGLEIADFNSIYSVDVSVTTDSGFGDFGGWFYRSATSTPSVPAPPTLALLLVPAVFMVAVRRQRQSH